MRWTCSGIDGRRAAYPSLTGRCRRVHRCLLSFILPSIKVPFKVKSSGGIPVAKGRRSSCPFSSSCQLRRPHLKPAQTPCYMLNRIRHAVFGIPFLTTTAKHSYSGPTTATAISMSSSTAANGQAGGYETATVANGCFWGACCCLGRSDNSPILESQSY